MIRLPVAHPPDGDNKVYRVAKFFSAPGSELSLSQTVMTPPQFTPRPKGRLRISRKQRKKKQKEQKEQQEQEEEGEEGDEGDKKVERVEVGPWKIEDRKLKKSYIGYPEDPVLDSNKLESVWIDKELSTSSKIPAIPATAEKLKKLQERKAQLLQEIAVKQKPEKPQDRSNWLLLVRQGDFLFLHPVDFYQFRQQVPYKTLTTEEAEAMMKKRQGGVRLRMNKILRRMKEEEEDKAFLAEKASEIAGVQDGDDYEELKETEAVPLETKEEVKQRPPREPKGSAKDGEEEEIDYEERWDDDEEVDAPVVEEDNDEDDKNLDESGKRINKLLKGSEDKPKEEKEEESAKQQADEESSGLEELSEPDEDNDEKSSSDKVIGSKRPRDADSTSAPPKPLEKKSKVAPGAAMRALGATALPQRELKLSANDIVQEFKLAPSQRLTVSQLVENLQKRLGLQEGSKSKSQVKELKAMLVPLLKSVTQLQTDEVTGDKFLVLKKK